VDRIKFSYDFDSSNADMRTFSSYLEDHFTHDYWGTSLPLWDLRDVEFEIMPVKGYGRESWRKLDPEDVIFPPARSTWTGKGVSSGHGAPGKVRVRGLDPYEGPHSDAYILRISITLEVEKDKAMIARSRLVPTQGFLTQDEQMKANTAFELYTMLHPSFHPGNRSMVFIFQPMSRSLKRLSTTVYFQPKYSPI
jgi:hypothetical protein